MNAVTFRVGGALLFAGLLATSPVHAQEPALEYKNVISANPFGLLLEWFNAEYERVIGESSTVGFGGSTFKTESYDDFGEEIDQGYTNADVFYRFYPSGRPLDGWTFGIKAGVTSVEDEGTFFGYGFDVNRSWLLGKRNNFYVGVGFGLKRLVGTPEDEGVELKYYPTFRLVNVGFAF